MPQPPLSPYFIRELHEHEVVGGSSFSGHVRHEVPFWEYWRIVRLHLGLILSIAGCAFVLAGLAVFIATPIYTATCEILIEPQPPQVLNIKQLMVEPPSGGPYDYYKTQFDLLRNLGLAASVIQLLDLQDNPIFAGRSVRHASLDPHPSNASDPPGVGTARARVPSGRLINAYLAALKIRPVYGTRLVKISFSSPDPQLAAIVANAHAQAYIRQGLNLRADASKAAERFLQNKLLELRERVEKSEVALNSYRHDKGLIEFPAEGDDFLVLKRLEELSGALTMAETRRITLEAQVAAAKERDYDSMPAVMNSATIQALKSELEPLEAQYAGLAARYTDNYPPVKALEAKIRDTRELLHAAIARVVHSTQLAYQTAAAREQRLRQAVDKAKARALALRDAAVKDSILARDVDTNRQLYANVLKRLKEIGVAGEIRSSNVSIVDRATPPLGPSSPRKGLTIVLATVLGLGIGVGIAFFLEQIDDTLKGAENIERYLGLPTLALVPDVRQSNEVALQSWGKEKLDGVLRNCAWVADYEVVKRFAWITKYIEAVGTEHTNGNGAAKGSGASDNEIKLEYRLAALEAYRTLRGRILLSRAGEPPRAILITSALAGEGKTITAANMAMTFARRERRVLVIDADLRRPRCHEVLNLQQGPGLTEVLTGQAAFDEVVIEAQLGIHVLRAGREPPDPPELLGSQSMADLLTGLRERYEHIIIDSAPVIPVSDTMMLSGSVDGVVIVAGSSTAKHFVKRASNHLLSSGAKLLGVILNRASTHPASYHYHGYSSYGYSYRRSQADGRGQLPITFE